MSTISSQLRTTKELTREEHLRLFFSLPIRPVPEDDKAQIHKMDISAVVSLTGDAAEESFVSFSFSFFILILES